MGSPGAARHGIATARSFGEPIEALEGLEEALATYTARAAEKLRAGGQMAGRIFNFEHPDRFVAGATGQPGNRTFYLQAREGSRIVSVLLEKVLISLSACR